MRAQRQFKINDPHTNPNINIKLLYVTLLTEYYIKKLPKKYCNNLRQLYYFIYYYIVILIIINFVRIGKIFIFIIIKNTYMFFTLFIFTILI